MCLGLPPNNNRTGPESIALLLHRHLRCKSTRTNLTPRSPTTPFRTLDHCVWCKFKLHFAIVPGTAVTIRPSGPVEAPPLGERIHINAIAHTALPFPVLSQTGWIDGQTRFNPSTQYSSSQTLAIRHCVSFFLSTTRCCHLLAGRSLCPRVRFGRSRQIICCLKICLFASFCGISFFFALPFGHVRHQIVSVPGRIGDFFFSSGRRRCQASWAREVRFRAGIGKRFSFF